MSSSILTLKAEREKMKANETPAIREPTVPSPPKEEMIQKKPSPVSRKISPNPSKIDGRRGSSRSRNSTERSSSDVSEVESTPWDTPPPRRGPGRPRRKRAPWLKRNLMGGKEPKLETGKDLQIKLPSITEYSGDSETSDTETDPGVTPTKRKMGRPRRNVPRKEPKRKDTSEEPKSEDIIEESKVEITSDKDEAELKAAGSAKKANGAEIKPRGKKPAHVEKPEEPDDEIQTNEAEIKTYPKDAEIKSEDKKAAGKAKDDEIQPASSVKSFERVEENLKGSNKEEEVDAADSSTQGWTEQVYNDKESPRNGSSVVGGNNSKLFGLDPVTSANIGQSLGKLSFEEQTDEPKQNDPLAPEVKASDHAGDGAGKKRKMSEEMTDEDMTPRKRGRFSPRCALM